MSASRSSLPTAGLAAISIDTGELGGVATARAAGVPDGAIVAIDIDSGDWAVADSVLGAGERLRRQRPDATDVWSVRVGHRAVYSFAGSSTRGASE